MSAGDAVISKFLSAKAVLCLMVILALACSVLVLPLPKFGLSSAPETNSVTAIDNLVSYVRARPFDALGHLALANAALPSMVDNAAKKDRFIETAAALAPTDPDVLLSRAKRALQRSEIANALRLLAQVQRQTQSNDALEAMLPFLGTKDWQKFSQELVATDAQLAGRNLEYQCARDVNPEHLLLLAHLLAARQLLRPAAVNCVAGKALAAGKGAAAQWLWVSSFTKLPTRIPLVFNGDFTLQTKGDVFDWRMPSGGVYRSGFAASLATESTRTSNNRVLALRFGARPVLTPLIEHALALAPGQYRMSYDIRSSAGIHPSSVSWMVRCAAGGEKAAIQALPNTTDVNSGWQTMSVSLKVPDSCDGQVLSLGMASQLLALSGLDGTVWIDNVVVNVATAK